jgi:hypothetical protein
MHQNQICSWLDPCFFTWPWGPEIHLRHPGFSGISNLKYYLELSDCGAFDKIKHLSLLMYVLGSILHQTCFLFDSVERALFDRIESLFWFQFGSFKETN